MSRFDVVGIGNAIVDVIAPAPDGFLDAMGIEKGVMQLVDRDRAEALYDAMERRTEAPRRLGGQHARGAGARSARAAASRGGWPTTRSAASTPRGWRRAAPATSARRWRGRRCRPRAR